MGPSHPATQGSVKLRVELDGESIVGLDVEVGYLHRGFEKECESHEWHQAIPYTDRLNYNSAILSSTAFCLAAEKLLQLEAPHRARWLRVLAGELARVADHLTRCGNLCRELGAATPFQYAIAARELVWDLLEMLCGARVTSGYLRIGGVKYDLPEGFAQCCDEKLAGLRKRLADFDALVTRNRIFIDRLKGTGILSRQDCLRYGVTGPLLRATGEDYDLRKVEPYLVYPELDFDVPVGSVGDNYDRYLVCLEEIRQSLRIVEQCVDALAKIGPGPVQTRDPRVVGGVPGERGGRTPGPLANPEVGPKVPAGETYHAIESANGELGFFLVSDGSASPYKVRCRPPSFLNLQPLPLMARGELLADLIPTLGLVNMVGGECDR
ncbi:MAG: NADH-quinone oxidoreductase subunit D [Deltaproteobacteria bacterium]|nr:NADH-quinone oxidoreductase subunit D [Deltaproteobacteria bacterium]